MRDTFSPNVTQNNKSTENSLENLRVLLWDIDGTLMRSNVQSGYKKYFSETMQKVFGSAGNLDGINPSGMTDTQIMFEALKNDGVKIEQIFERKAEILEVFQAEMTKVLAEDGEPYEILGGAKEILQETSKDQRFVNALLTGNLSVAAEIKLRSVGLWHYFQNAPNIFGEISHNRKDLATSAGIYFNEAYRFNFAPEQFIVIGDTPNDILCARHFGAKCVAVLTGRNQLRERLESENPDVVIDDLSDTENLLKILKQL